MMENLLIIQEEMKAKMGSGQEEIKAFREKIQNRNQDRGYSTKTGWHDGGLSRRDETTVSAIQEKMEDHQY
jgi:hypothetical protein